MARASQGGHTLSCVKVVLQKLATEYVSSTVLDTTNLNSHQKFDKLGIILKQHITELQALCKQFPSINPQHMVTNNYGMTATVVRTNQERQKTETPDTRTGRNEEDEERNGQFKKRHKNER